MPISNMVIQTAEQPQVDTVNEEVRDWFGTDEVVGKIGSEDEYVGLDPESEAVQKLPTSNQLSNA